MRFIILSFAVFLFSHPLYGQGCCSGGSGCPIAGGSSPGVLLAKQMELGSSFQYINGNKFFSGDKDTTSLFDNFNSKYIYTRLAYGVTKELTVSVEAGYFIDKKEKGLHGIDTMYSSGIGDLIVFPKYDIYSRVNEKKRVDITVGLGYKYPLGKHMDSTVVYYNPNGHRIYAIMPPLLQPTTGSQDIILYAFFYRGFPKHNFRLFANSTYIRKGWNSLGIKFGDYASAGLFAGKTFFKSLGVTLQLKGEWIDTLDGAKHIKLRSYYNIDRKSTGSKKIILAPQISYNIKAFSIYVLGEIPVYQYVNGSQMVSTPVTLGVSYRFLTAKNLTAKAGEIVYECPMKCEGSQSKSPGKCPVCGMELIEKK